MARAAIQCAVMLDWPAPPRAAAFRSSYRRLTLMPSMRNLVPTASTSILLQVHMPLSFSMETIVIEELVLQAAAAHIIHMRGSAPVVEQEVPHLILGCQMTHI